VSVARILIDVLPPPGTELIVPDDQAHHLRSVRRVRNNDLVQCIDRCGATAQASIIEITATLVRVRVGGVMRASAPGRGAAARLVVMPALVPEARFDWILQKCTEIGVAECRPVVAARCVVRKVRGGFERKLTRWQKICDEAARQCGGPPMRMHAPCSFDDALQLDAPLRVIADRDGTPLSDGAGVPDRGIAEAALLVGPEGGFTDDELNRACNCGWLKVAFNHNTMRVETAALVCCAVLQHALACAGGAGE
jgi:16S rRNA (uracil1498-N3)-methyltransferase